VVALWIIGVDAVVRNIQWQEQPQIPFGDDNKKTSIELKGVGVDAAICGFERRRH
jgi:hypothetical protein